MKRSLKMPRFTLLLFLLLSGCAHPTARRGAGDAPLPPNTFRFSAHWAQSGGYSVKCVEKSIALERYFAESYGKDFKRTTHTFHPDNDHWDRFWNELTVLSVFQWRKEYKFHLSYADGPMWYLDASYHGHRISSHGDFAYPAVSNVRKISDDRTRVSMLEASIQRLIGHSLY